MALCAFAATDLSVGSGRLELSACSARAIPKNHTKQLGPCSDLLRSC